MKTLLIPLLLIWSLASSWAATTINPVNKYACGANLGWLNAYADGINGAVVTDYTLSGF